MCGSATPSTTHRSPWPSADRQPRHRRPLPAPVRAGSPVAGAAQSTSRAASAVRAGWLVPIDDLMTAAGLLVHGRPGTATAPTETAVDQLHGRGRPTPSVKEPAMDGAADLRRPRPRLTSSGPDTVQVTALWGWSGVPDAIRQACLLQASRLLSRRDSPFGVAGSPEAGTELRLLVEARPRRGRSRSSRTGAGCGRRDDQDATLSAAPTALSPIPPRLQRPGIGS
jgi:hypothetical protein